MAKSGLLKNDAILEDVVKTLHLDEKRSGYEGPWYKASFQQAKDWVVEIGKDAWMLLKFGRLIEEDRKAAAIQSLRDNVKVTNRDSYIFNLQVRDKYPDRAAKIADHMANVLAAWLLELDRRPGHARVEQLHSLLQEKAKLIAQRRVEIESLLRQNDVASVQLETARLTENFSALQLEESRLASEIARARARQVSVQSKLSVKQRILNTSDGPDELVEVIQPEDFRKLASEKVFDDVELQSLLAKHASLQNSITAVATRLHKLPSIQSRLDTLKLSLDSLERENALLNDSYQEAALRATSPVSEVRVLHPAVVPSSPAAPIKVFHVLLASGLGLLFAVGLVYLLDFLGIGILFAAQSYEERTPPAIAPSTSLGELPLAEGRVAARNG